MLRVAMKYADLIDRVFQHLRPFDTPGHEEIELALRTVSLLIGEERYFKLAEYFINTRGNQRPMRPIPSPIRAYAVPPSGTGTGDGEGHSVRALHLILAWQIWLWETKEEKRRKSAGPFLKISPRSVCTSPVVWVPPAAANPFYV